MVRKQCRHGEMMFLTHDRYVGRSLDLYGEFSELEAEIFVSNVRPGDYVVEVGSNIGAHTVHLARLVGPHGVVHAFEPQRIIFQILCANLAINGITNVWAYQEALGRQTGTIRVPAIDYAVEGNFGGVSLTNTGSGEDVPMRTIDSMALKQLRLLKIDAEGMEAEILAGARATIARFRPVLYVENDRKDQSPKLIRMIDGLGYRMWWHLPPLFNPQNFSMNPNNVFGHIVSINLLCLPNECSESVPNLRAVTDPDDSWERHILQHSRRRSASAGAPRETNDDHHVDDLVQQAIELHRQGEIVEAEAIYRARLEQEPRHAMALNMLGAAAYQQGRHGEAEQLISRAIEIDPNLVSAWSNRGLALHSLGRFDEALSDFDRAIQIRPDHADAWNNRGMVLRSLKRLDEALASCDRAVQLRPDHPETLNSRGLVLRDLKRFHEALASYDRALELKPSSDALNNRGNVLSDLKRLGEALASFDRALQLQPDLPRVMNNRGNALRELNRLEDALACFERALQLRPDYPEALSNRGNALRDLDRPEEALASYDRAIALKPAYAQAHYNRGHALQDLKRLDASIASFDRALELEPHYSEARAMRGIIRLLAGRYREGWPDYEYRWHFSESVGRPPAINAPVWRGENLTGRRIAVYSEQGIGDIIQFARYLRLLVQQGAEVTFVAPVKLVRLLRSATAGIRVVTSVDAQEVFDFQCALMSLPLRFGTELSSIPNGVPYLAAEDDLVSLWRERIGSRGFKIGINWQGRPGVPVDKGRSIPLTAFAPLAAVPNVRLISLQRKYGLEQLEHLPAGMNVELLSDEVESGLDEFIGTAAVMNCLDLVVTCDTSIAHLAGALARPTWLAVKHVAEWRWMLDRDDSPWYPTIRLYRQRTRGDWDSVLHEMARALPSMQPAAGGSASSTPQQSPPDAAGAEAVAFNLRGNLLRNQNRLDEALMNYERAVALKPDFAEAIINCGNALLVLRRPEEALATFDRALQIRPDYVQALNNRGTVLLTLKRPLDALAAYDRALAIRPDYADALSNRGNALLELDKPNEALTSYDRALALLPNQPHALCNRGKALRELGRPEAALECYDQVLALKPESANANVDRGVALQDLKRLNEAVASFDRALQLKPNYAEARLRRGMAKLLLGQYRDGWADYEARKQDHELEQRRPNLDVPHWQGENLAGRRIAVYTEQGLGDVIQFARYLPLLVRQSANVSFFAEPKIARLLQPVTQGIQLITSREGLKLPFDFQCALMSLPLRFGTELSSIPNRVPYLAAEDDLVLAWREKLTGNGFKIGIAWQGRPGPIDKGRSIPLHQFARLCQVPNLRLINLQKTERLQPLDDPPTAIKLESPGEFDSGPDAFIDTAAIMMNLDLVITSDTCIAHLAGALGRPTWVALQYVPDWRWLLDRDDSPWYPRMRVFRQRARGDWDSLFQEMVVALRAIQPAADGSAPGRRRSALRDTARA
jgi:FkbM family methyltransferase